MREWVNELTEALKKALADVAPNSATARALSQTADTMTELQKLWDEALVGAVENKAKSPAVNSEAVQYEVRDDNYPTEGVHWGIEAGIIDKTEARSVWEAIANYSRRGYYYPETTKGEIFVSSGQFLMVVDANYNRPTVTTIIQFNEEYEDNAGYAKELIINAQGDPSRHREALRVIENTYGSGYVIEYNRRDYSTDVRQTGQRKRENSRRNIEKSSKVKYSLRDGEYMTAVQNGNMETAQRMVDEAAEQAMPDSAIRDNSGKLLPVYHGTRAQFWEFNTKISGGVNGTAEGFGIYLTDNPEVSESYGDRIIKGYANIKRPATSFKKTIKRTELARLIELTCKKEAERMMADDGYDNIADAQKDTWISNYIDTYSYSSFKTACTAAANVILQGNSDDMNIMQEVMVGMGIRDYEDAMAFYNEALIPATGIDGFWTQWENNVDGKPSNIILAVSSNQVKSADPVTYDDKGNVIPLSERFDSSKADIRWSMRDPAQMAEDAVVSAEAAANRSSREILANAMETAAQTDLERRKLADYRKKIGLMNEQEQKLERLKGELAGAQGDRAKDLRDEIKRTENRINTYDGQLLRLEAARPLQDVLDREKAALNKKLEEAKVWRKEWRERAATAKAEGSQRLREYRTKRNESDAVKKYRKRIESTANTMLDWLTKNNDKKHVPEELKGPLVEFLEALDMSSDRSRAGGDQTKKELAYIRKFNRMRNAIESGRITVDGGTLDLGDAVKDAFEIKTKPSAIAEGFAN